MALEDELLASQFVTVMQMNYQDAVLPALQNGNYREAQNLMEHHILLLTRQYHEAIERGLHMGIELISSIDSLYKDTRAAARGVAPVRENVIREVTSNFRQTKLPKSRE